MGKLSFLIGAGAGYVLGTRAGREQYDKIIEATRKARSNPKVQQAKDAAAERGGQVFDEAKDKAADKAPDWVPGSRTSEEGSPVAASTPHTDRTIGPT